MATKSRFYVIEGLASVPGAPFGNLAISKPSSWLPSTLGSALGTWYDASQNVTSAAGLVSAMAPVSGPGPTLASTGTPPALTAINGQPAIYPNAAQAYLQSPSAGLGISDSAAFSLVIAGRIDKSQRNLYSDLLWLGPNISQCLRVGFPSAQGGALTMILSGSGSIGDPANSLELKTAEVPATGFLFVLGMTYDGTGKAAGTKLYLNGLLDASSTVTDTYALGSTSLTTGSFTLGSSYGTNTWCNDAVAGLFTATRVMTAGEMASASSYYLGLL